MKREPRRLWRAVEQWMAEMEKIPELELVWLEGSLAEGRACPASDIDVKMGIRDDAYESLWIDQRERFFKGLAAYYLLPNEEWSRLLTEDGLIFEIHASPTSRVLGSERYPWKMLLSRIGDPGFREKEILPPSVVWADPQPLTPKYVRKLADYYLLVLAHLPAPFYNGELQSARFILDHLGLDLVKIMYRRLGVRFPKKYKHLSRVLPDEYMEILSSLPRQESGSSMDLGVMARATMRTFAVLADQLAALSEQAGGGYDRKRFDRLYGQVEELMQPFTGDI